MNFDYRPFISLLQPYFSNNALSTVTDYFMLLR